MRLRSQFDSDDLENSGAIGVSLKHFELLGRLICQT